MKPAYLDELDLRAIPPDRWQVLNTFRYRTLVGGEKVITVPAGAINNLASIPRLARPLITGMGYDRWAATVHDHLYSIKHPRAEADAIFREALKTAYEQNCGCEKSRWFNKLTAATKRGVMWSAVRLGGWIAYRSEP